MFASDVFSITSYAGGHSTISLDAYYTSCSDWMLVESAVVLWSGRSSQFQAQQTYGPFLHLLFFLSELSREAENRNQLSRVGQFCIFSVPFWKQEVYEEYREKEHMT